MKKVIHALTEKRFSCFIVYAHMDVLALATVTCIQGGVRLHIVDHLNLSLSVTCQREHVGRFENSRSDFIGRMSQN